MNPKNSFISSTSQNISLTMTIAEGMFGGDPMWPFFRRTLLRRLNDIKRDALAALEDIETQNGNTVCYSVSCAVKNNSQQASVQGVANA